MKVMLYPHLKIKKMIKFIEYLTFFFLVLIVNSYALELKIISDSLKVDRDKKISIFSGNVFAQNQDIQIWSGKLIVKFNKYEDEIEQLNAEHEVKIIRQDVTATGEKGVYSPKQDTLNMYGNVEVYQDNNFVTCDELFLDIKNSISIMKSASSKKVEAFIIDN